ncbi:hypothetical protein HYT55_05420 [Candidatus Woesearchaeota archaeon]|nr:hypothetical protein [Candidatus Woesearchaeota archaeon]
MPKTNISTETRLTRGQFFAENIVSAVRGGNLSTPVNILLVGIGSHRYFGCGYEAYNTFACLEHAGVDYRATVVDLLPELVADFQERGELYVSFRTLNDLENESRKAWSQYLQWTGQGEKIVDTSQVVIPSQRRGFRREFPNVVVRAAKIPASLEQKLGNQEVVAVQGNIKSIDLQQYGPFTAAACVNVLYQLGREPRDTMKAILNITSNVERSGLVYLDLPWLPFFNFDPSFSVDVENSLQDLMGLERNHFQGDNVILYRKSLPYGSPTRRLPRSLPILLR